MSPSASEKSLHLSVKPLRSSFYVVHVERIDLFHFAFHVCVELFRSTCVYLVTLPSHSHQASWRAFLVNSFFESLCAERSSLNWVTSAGKEGGGLVILQAHRILISLFSKESSSVNLGGNETSASSARMAIRMCISGLRRCGRGSYNWYLP